MSAQQADVFNQFSATFSPAAVKKWEAMVTTWNANPKARNPYQEPRSGKILYSQLPMTFVFNLIQGTTLQDVRLLLVKEEVAQAALG